MGRTVLARCLLPALGCAFLVACADEPPPPRRAIAPVAAAPTARPASVARAQRPGVPSITIAILAETLQDRGFTITRLDPVGGIVTARRAAAPLDYVACSSIPGPAAAGSRNVRPAAVGGGAAGGNARDL